MGNPDKEREAALGGQSSEAPPPAYDDTAEETIPTYERPTVGNADDAQQLVPATIKFPPFLTCITTITSMSSMHLGPDSKDKRFSVTANTKEVILRDGPKKSDPTIAQISTLNEGKYGTSAIYVPRPGGEPIRLLMPGDHSNRQPFSLDVGKDRHVEHFEWRQSQGNEVEEVGQTKLHGYGWKLVRLTGDVEGEGGKRKHRDFGFTSDGKEVVAAWSSTSKFWKGPNFSFLGTGLTGTLGEVFETVAVITFVRLMWLQTLRSAQSGAAWYSNRAPHPGMVGEDAGSSMSG